jgi:hypothetical protein
MKTWLLAKDNGTFGVKESIYMDIQASDRGFSAGFDMKAAI